VYSESPKDIIAYYEVNSWVEIQIPLDAVIINDVEIYKNELILGTSNGIYKMTFN
jgi:hypothetical protein